MPITILHQDITAVACDVIVNPTDRVFSGIGGTDLSIHTAAGEELAAECSKLPPLAVGEVCATGAYRLPAAHVIHTVGPKWQGGGAHETEFLYECYIHALELAVRLGAASVAFPMISSGHLGFPKKLVLRLALTAISDFLYRSTHEMEVFLCVTDKNAYELTLRKELAHFLRNAGDHHRTVFESEVPACCRDDFSPVEYTSSVLSERISLNGGKRHTKNHRRTPSSSGEKGSAFSHSCESRADLSLSEDEADVASPAEPEEKNTAAPFFSCMAGAADTAAVKVSSHGTPALCSAAKMSDTCDTASAALQKPAADLSTWLKQHDDSFAVTLMKMIDSKGMTDVECYKKANISRKTFSKINTDKNYKPSKPTVIAFAIALRLNLSETELLLKTVGFSLSHSNVFDMIIEFFILSGNYDIYEINEALYQYDQVCLGC